MRWRLYLGVGVVAVGSIVAVVIAIASVTGSDELQRVKSALRLQTNCARIDVRRPSSVPVVRQWAGLTVRSADFVCARAGVRITYAKFLDQGRLDRGVATSQPPGSYCVLGNAIMIARITGAGSTVLSDMCQSLGGRMELTS